MFRKWEVQRGRGDAILGDIGHDVRARRQLGPSIPMMGLIAQAHVQTADILLAGQAQRTRLPYDAELESRFSDVSANLTQRQLEAASDIYRLIEEARELEEREYLGESDPDFRVRIKALESGVVGWRASGSAGGSETKGETELLEEGEVREGKGGAIRSITSAPHLGGELVMDFAGRNPVRKGIHVTGLVSPETGIQQVEMAILMKTG